MLKERFGAALHETVLSSQTLTERTSVADWLVLLVSAAATGAACTYLLVVPRRWLPLPGVLIVCGLLSATRSMDHVLKSSEAGGSIGMAILLSGLGVSAGFWLAATSLPLWASRNRETSEMLTSTASDTAVTLLVLSFAAPERYRVRRTAWYVRRLIESGALELPASAIPFVFLSERSRYGAIGDYLPARASTTAIVEQLEATLRVSAIGRIVIAWGEGSLKESGDIVASVAASGGRAVVVTLGADGSFRATEAILELESALEAVQECDSLLVAPSIWHSGRLAQRLVTRILDTTRGAEPDAVGVVLVGEGQPEAWESHDRGWRERENYFNQRVRLLLTERGIREHHVKAAWLEWQTPDVTEAVRHLAALGCTRIVIAPSTIACVTLSTAIDLEHMVASARVAEDVQTVTLAPWGDDPALAQAAAEAARQALEHAR